MSGAEEQRAGMLEVWEIAADGWGRRAQRVREWGMPVSSWMLHHLHLGPGQRVLELAAGPGDTGFLAAELIQPGGTLICSDAAEAMLKVACGRAESLGISNVEFRRLQLEWIDLPTADVDAILCRWGLMLTVDPAAALQECRRVLRPGGHLALAVWDEASRNPWATIPTRALVGSGHLVEGDSGGPGMFALADPERLDEMLGTAGFTDVLVEGVDVQRDYESVQAYLEETLDLSRAFRQAFDELGQQARDEVAALIESLSAPYRRADGGLRLPGRTLVTAARA